MIEFVIKTPQLIGIILGCCVFAVTIIVVSYLLVASGSLISKSTNEPNRDSKFPLFGYPQLYDELLQARQELPNKPHLEELTGNKIKLTTLSNTDLNGLISCSNGDAIFGESKYDPISIWGWCEKMSEFSKCNLSSECLPCYSVDLFKQFYDMNDKKCEDRNFSHIVITDKEMNKPIGMISLVDNDTKNLSIRFTNMWITPHFQHTNRSLEAIYLLSKHLFSIGYRRLTVEIDARNVIFKKFLDKAGFKLEAILRKHKIVYERNCDTCVYALLNSEFEDVHIKLSRVLDYKLKIAKSLTAISQ